jgi:hypothetical protein
MEFLADRHGENADDIPVDEIEDVGEQKEEENARAKGALSSRNLVFRQNFAPNETKI